MKTIITVSVMAALLMTSVQAEGILPAGAEQACAAKAADIKNIRMSEIRTGRAVRWADGSGAVILDLPQKKKAACWVTRKGEVTGVFFGTGVGPAQEQACAGEAAGIKDVRMSELRSPWSVKGPKGKAWVLLTLKGKKMDCLVSSSGEVLTVESYR